MNYPVWDVGFGLPLLIAVVAILHVFVAHFAIGGGLFLVLYEAKARKEDDSEMLDYVRQHSRFFMLLTLVFGALTGVGIWFTIGLIHPGATSSLIRIFVWFWATEWVMFFVEITASLVYYYGWDRLSAKTHQAVMWVYFGAAWGSLAVINGIITFMLTPGSWIENGNIWSAFFNPTYFPSLVLRTALAFMLAGLFAFLTGSGIKNIVLKKRVMRSASMWCLPALAIFLLSGLWYFSAIPNEIIERIGTNWFALQTALKVGVLSAILLLIGILVSPLSRPAGMKRAEAVILLLAGLALFGSFEWLREATRKPYVIRDYMYSDGSLKSDENEIRQTGYTAGLKWKHEDESRRGEDLFNAMCKRCHSLRGYNSILERTYYMKDHTAELVKRIGYMKAAMPPFRGTEGEADSIAAYLWSEQGKDMWGQKTIPDRPTELAGEAIWVENCGLCHTIDRFRPLLDVFSGVDEEEALEVVLMAEELDDAMPPFYGSEVAARWLAQYIVAEVNKAEERGEE